MWKKYFHRSHSGVISTWFFSMFLICISLASLAAENQIRLISSMANLQVYQKYLGAECEIIRDIRRLQECGELEEGTYRTASFCYEVAVNENNLYVTVEDPAEVLLLMLAEDGTVMDYEAYRDPPEIKG